MFAVKNGQFEGIFFDIDNANLAVGDYVDAEIKDCETVVDAINHIDKIVSKFYAVANGRIVGIFLNWPDCSTQVTRYSGAIYHSFHDVTEAIDYVKNEGKKVSQDTDSVSEVSKDQTCIAYVDGSFNVKHNEYGWGVVMFLNGEKNFFSGSGNDAENAKLRNVAGEIIAARRAIEKAMDCGYKEIHIYYDYYGIEMWATGAWKRKTKQTIDYNAFINSVKDKITVHFHKVKAHTGVSINEEVDRLAKSACGI